MGTFKSKISLDDYILNCMKSRAKMSGKLVDCPNCWGYAEVMDEGEEVHTHCQACGFMAVDGMVIVKGAEIC